MKKVVRKTHLKHLDVRLKLPKTILNKKSETSELYI